MLHTKNTAYPTENALQLFQQPAPVAAAASPTLIALPPSTLEFIVPHNAPSLNRMLSPSNCPLKTHLLV